jgi:hypothetical protein
MKAVITSFCSIREDRVIVNGNVELVPRENRSVDEYVALLYRTHSIEYPKFFKMDSLCKLGVVTSELLLNMSDYKSRYGSNVGVVLSNASSSIGSDRRYVDTFKDKSDYFPSPALFVYTLPNVVIGELCIRHHLTGENAFFIEKDFEPDLLCNYVNNLLKAATMECCITGWVDVSHDRCDSILFFVEKHGDPNNRFELPFESATLLSLYQKS